MRQHPNAPLTVQQIVDIDLAISQTEQAMSRSSERGGRWHLPGHAGHSVHRWLVAEKKRRELAREKAA